MQVIVVLAPAQQQRVHFQVLLDQSHHRNRSPLADENRLAAEPCLDGPDRGPETGTIHADQHGRRTLMGDDLDGNSGWSDLPDVGAKELADGRRLLVGYQPKTELRSRLAGENRLGSGSRIAAEQAVDIAGGSSPLPLERGVAILAHQSRHGQIGLEIRLRERHLGEFGAFPVFQRLDSVVKPRDPDLSIRPFQAGQDGRQGVERVGHGTAEGAGVQVAVGSLNVDLEVGQALQAVGDGRHSRGQTDSYRK